MWLWPVTASDFATLIHLIERFHKPKASGLVSKNQVSIRYMPIFPMLARIVTGNFYFQGTKCLLFDVSNLIDFWQFILNDY